MSVKEEDNERGMDVLIGGNGGNCENSSVVALAVKTLRAQNVLQVCKVNTGPGLIKDILGRRLMACRPTNVGFG